MQFAVKKSKVNIIDLLRRIGYHFQREDKKRGELAFYHPLSTSNFPRFHLYLKIQGESLIFNLHLDQRKPMYKDAPAHSADYEGERIEKERERIKKVFTGL